METAPRAPVDEADRPAQEEVYEEEEQGPVPLHLKILGVVMAIYLLYRLIQGIVWVAHQF